MFPFFSLILRIFTLLDIEQNPFLTRKTPFFLLFSYFLAHPTTLLKILGRTNAWAVPPHLKLWGTVPQSPQVSAPAREPSLFYDRSSAYHRSLSAQRPRCSEAHEGSLLLLAT